MKNKYFILVFALIIISPSLQADEGFFSWLKQYRSKDNFINWVTTITRMKGVKPVTNKTYENEKKSLYA